MDLKKTFRRFRSALSRPFYLLTIGSFTAPATSDYELFEPAIHHEIEGFFATTVGRMRGYYHRGIRG